MARKKKEVQPKQPVFSVFAPRVICGEEIEPFCVPTKENMTSHMMAAATNLLWWAMHESLADGKMKDAKNCGQLVIDIVGKELSSSGREEASEIINEIFERYRQQTDGF